QDRDRVYVPVVTRIGDYPETFDQLDDEHHGQSDQEQGVTDDGPPQQAQTDYRQQRRRDEQQPGGGDGHRCDPDFLPWYQREQRNRECVGERGERRQGSDAMDLSRVLLPAQPFYGD